MLVRKSNKYYFSQISFKLRESLLLRNYETQTTRWLIAPLFFFDRIPDNSIEFDMTIKERYRRKMSSVCFD